MAARIIQHPCLEVLPNHAGPHYNNICQLLINTGLALKQAIHSLNNSWMHNCEELIQAWDQQVLDDNFAAEEAQRVHLEKEQSCLQQEQQDLENKRSEAEKKKPKMNNFEETTMVGNYIAPHLHNMPCAVLKILNTWNYGI
jgi:predicted ribosome quality control (RQC) complex YloA/Tae2 family protein